MFVGSPDQRGVISGLLSLSRNLGLITGASALGAVFAIAVGASDITTAAPEAIASGMQTTFAVAAGLIAAALAVAAGVHALTVRQIGRASCRERVCQYV